MTNNDFVLVNIPDAFAGKTLMEALESLGYTIDAPCGGSGRCRNCVVLVKSGEYFTEKKSCRELVGKDGDVVKLKPGTYQITKKTEEKPQKSKGNKIANGALDIGTTTIEFAVLKDGKAEFFASMLNPQKIHGADVISRIDYGSKNQKNLLELTEAVRNGVKQLINSCKEYDFEKIVVCGNPTMISLFLGIDPKTIGEYPYVSPEIPSFANIDGIDYVIIPGANPKDWGSGFMGGDALAAGGFADLKNNQMMIDLGTNGEMVLRCDDKFYGASTAAGPCFEGANISCGIGGVTGAVSSVAKKNGVLSISTIKGGKPIGICGSGLIDLVSVLLEDGIVTKDGYLEENYELRGIKDGFMVDTGLCITPHDIRNIQMAKSAIISGIYQLVKSAGTDISKIDKLYVAGGLGRYISIENAIRIGLFPKELDGKIEAIGNGALKFAALVANDEKNMEKMDRIIRNLKLVQIAECQSFQEDFIKNMIF